jgi:hypothetical protein
MAENNGKQRKSESQEIFEQADNAGRFSGDDTDSQSARKQAIENIREDSLSTRQERDKDEDSNAEARRDPAQSTDYKGGEAKNVNDDHGIPLDGDEARKARNKATEGLKQGRSDS